MFLAAEARDVANMFFTILAKEKDSNPTLCLSDIYNQLGISSLVHQKRARIHATPQTKLCLSCLGQLCHTHLAQLKGIGCCHRP